MPSTERKQRQVDKRLVNSGGGTSLSGSSGAPAGPAVPTPPAPTNLRVVSTKILFSAVSPMASASLAWAAPSTVVPQRYVVQWAVDSGFTSPTTRQAAAAPTTAEIDGLPVATTIYFRVAAIVNNVQGAWSNTASSATPSDTTAPAAPTSIAFSWSGLTGDLSITWTNPGSTNFRDVRVRVYASNGGTLYHEGYSASGRYVWTRGQHYAETSGTFDPSVYVILTARSWGGVFSATDLTGTATLAAPTAPTGLTSSWAADGGTAGPGCLVTWTQSAAVASYRLSIDGVARDVGYTGRYDYPFTLNQAEHAGTADPVLSLSLVAVDALGQSSTAATTTATNAAPPATTITVFAGFSSVGLTIGASAAQDIKDYRVRVYKAAVLVRTVYFTDLRPTYAVEDGDGSYTFDVAARDVFGQIGTASAQTSPATVTDLAGFVTTLRSGLIYTDSVSTAAATLALLKDADLTTNVVTYTASTPWRWTMADWQEEITTQTVEFAVSATCSIYIGYSLDGSTWTWFHGTAPSGGRWQPVASTSTEATAQTGAQTFTVGTWRIDIPAPRRARFIRIGHRNTTTSYAFREFFPATLIRGTYMQAESITAVQIAAGTITANNISSTALNSFTITGATIQTAASGQRVLIDSTGLKTYDSAGNVVVEASTATNGGLYLRQATNGPLRLVTDAAGDEIGRFWGSGDTAYIGIQGQGVAVELEALSGAVAHRLSLDAGGASSLATFTHSVKVTKGLRVGTAASASDGSIAASGGINVGTATGAATGEIRASGPINSDRNTMIGGSGTPASRLHVVGSQLRLDPTTTLTDRGLLFQFNGGFPEIRAGQVGNYGTAEPLLLQAHGGLLSIGGALLMNSITAPSTPATAGQGVLYIDATDNDLKVKFANGTVRTIALN
jgi:hypothetical protein